VTSVRLSALVALTLGGCRAGPAPLPPHRSEPARESRPALLRVDTLTFARFGPVVVYRESEHPARVVLFVSGDGGWNHGVVDMARSLASLDALVVGVDVRRCLAALDRSGGPCGYPAADLEALSQWVQRRLGYPAYVQPVLVGYSSGATLVYATLVQAPPGTFRAGLSLGLCADLRTSKPLCRAGGLATIPGPNRSIRLLPTDTIRTPWVVLQGERDSSCTLALADSLVRRVRGARLVRLPGVGHGFSVQAHWLPQLRQVFEQVSRAEPASAAAPAVRDLPLVELPVKAGTGELAVIVSGDGGWAGIDRDIGEALASKGIPVVGLNSLRYFWRARTPDESGRDLARILRHYLDAWKARDAVLVGYSLGADVLPFMASRLPPDLRSRVRLVALLAPGRTASFEFHVSQWLGKGGGGPPTAPEIERLSGLRVLCLYGTDDRDSACPMVRRGLAEVVRVPGGHHFGGSYASLVERILQGMGPDRAGATETGPVPRKE
jgi:type IV secretory pathway VirJ component